MCKGTRGIIISAFIYTPVYWQRIKESPNNIACIVHKIPIFSLILLKMYVGLRFYCSWKTKCNVFDAS